ncbi:MAG: hypothetical protein PF447_02365 [Spirochaetaceae bacterium]|jgi:hypothetical protein|nr:hypothetical protein [Spirochaetaceae bacterium]
MKRGYLRFPAVLVLLFLFFNTAWADESVLRLESVVIDTFDQQGSATYNDGEAVIWKVVGSEFATEDYPKQTYATGTWPVDLFGSLPEDSESLGVLGIRTQYNRQAYNQIDIIPGRGEGDSWEAQGVPLPGRVQTIDFWVWGSNYNYGIEIYIMDYRGFEYKLDPIRVTDSGTKVVNSLKYTGWRNFYVDIPNYIKQAVEYDPSLAQMRITRFVVYTHPEEIVTDSFLYIDHLKVLSDIHESKFDGYELSSPERISEIWGEEE